MSADDLMQQLLAPFEAREVKWKPATVAGNRALALCYVDARVIMDRLDAVLGVDGWQDEYEFLPDGSCLCKLQLRLGGEWVTKMDVGGESEQPDEGDRHKAAVSDALKRAAVKFGVGRYLYRLPSQWVDWDAPKKKFARAPVLPAWALPGAKAQPVKSGPTNGKPAVALPRDGAELVARLEEFEKRMVQQRLCRAGDLLTAVRCAGTRAGYVPELVRWPAAAMALAVEETRKFEARCRAGEGPIHA